MELNFQVTLCVVESWNTGGNGKILIKNLGQTVTNWQFSLNTSNFQITQFWNLVKSGSTVKPAAWNGTLNAGATLESGFGYTGSSDFQATSSTAGVELILKSDPPVVPPVDPVVPPVDPVVPPVDPVVPPVDPTKKKLFGYFTEWSIYDRQFSVEQIPANKLTHVIYAFMLPNPSQEDFNTLKNNYPFPPKPYRAPPTVPEGQLVYHDEYAGQQNIQKLKTLKQQYPHLKVLISIGGWTLSWTLSKIAANKTLRTRLIESAVKFIIDNGLDGIDIDWEYVGKQGVGYNYVDPVNDTPNFIQMLSELRAHMDAQSPNKHLEITAAMGTNPIVINNYKGTEPFFDYILLMTYDYAGSWGDGGHHSGMNNNTSGNMDPQWNVTSAVENTKNIGYSNDKICVGCPVYGRGWKKIVPNNAAQPIFGKSTAGAGISYSGAAGEPGLTSWRHLRPVLNVNGLNRYYDSTADAVYCHNSSTGETWTYEDTVSAEKKAQFVVDNNLGGMLFWELSDDTRDGKENILDTVVKTFETVDPTDPPVDPVDPPVDPVDPPVDPVDPPVDPTDPPVDPPVDPVNPNKGLTVIIVNNGDNDVILKPGQQITLTL